MAQKTKSQTARLIGVAGTILLTIAFLKNPSFPTPDKIIVYFVFVFMIFSQAVKMLKMLLPFVLILLVYDSFRGIADELNKSVNYSLSPMMDRLMFGQLPTVTLQNWLWRGHVSWYDYVLYWPYFLHFILPLVLALIIWKTRTKDYWQFVTTFCLVSFAAFFTFWLMPTAPPWLASQQGHIEPITRISSELWSNMGIKNFPSVYNEISPNPVAAVPSLHAAWALLILIFVTKFFGRRWGLVAALYPAFIFFGTIYEGEHYVFDIIIGCLYATGAYYVTPILLNKSLSIIHRLRHPLQPHPKRVSRPSRA